MDVNELLISQFIVAVGSVVTLHLLARTVVTAGGMRDWLRGRGSREGA